MKRAYTHRKKERDAFYTRQYLPQDVKLAVGKTLPVDTPYFAQHAHDMHCSLYAENVALARRFGAVLQYDSATQYRQKQEGAVIAGAYPGHAQPLLLFKVKARTIECLTEQGAFVELPHHALMKKKRDRALEARLA